MYYGIWEEETVHELPASFALFKHELMKANDEGLIPNQPFEESTQLDLDKIDAATWIRSMQTKIRTRTDKESLDIYARFQKELLDGKLKNSDPMIDVIGTHGSVLPLCFRQYY